MVNRVNSPSNTILKVGVIGLGRQALNDHVPALLRREDVAITCISDPDTSAHDMFFHTYPSLKGKVNAYRDYSDIITEGVDFAIVAIPHDQHFQVSEELCRNKIPFMKEKPFARTLDEAIALAMIEDSALYCFICTQRRFHPLYSEALKSIPRLGKVGSFSATYTLNLPLTASGWRKSSEVSGGGVIIDMGYHIIDQLIWWLGYPDDIHAKISNLSTSEDIYDTEDSATIVFSYKNTGLQGSIVLSRCTGIKTEGYQLAGSECFMEGSKTQLLVKDRRDGKVLLSKGCTAKEEVMDNQLSCFIDTFTSGRSFEENHLDNLLNMKFIERCYRNKLSKDNTLFINAYKHQIEKNLMKG